MKRKHILIPVLVISLLFCNIAYASDVTDPANNETAGDITDCVILNEYIDEVEDGTSNVINGISLYSDAFTDCSYNMTCYEEYMHFYFSTGYSRKAEKIGIYNFKVQQKVWYGWKTIFSRSELYNTNTTFCSRGYDLVVDHGGTYRITGTHFAIVDGVTKKLSAASGSMYYK